jgi:flagellar motor switch protein FliG
MTNTTSNLRKAAILIRSLDADSAAALLAQLSPAEAASVRQALRELGSIDPEEQADLVVEFRRTRPLATEPSRRGVELTLSTLADAPESSSVGQSESRRDIAKRFEFLEKAPTNVLVSYLSREHAQTIAVLLAHLAPAHAAEVLSALPDKLQADTIERLSLLGETDSEVVAVLESELAAWAATRLSQGTARGDRRDAMAAILSAADEKTRSALVKRLKSQEPGSTNERHAVRPLSARSRDASYKHFAQTSLPAVCDAGVTLPKAQPPVPSPPPLPAISFEHLIHLDDETLATVLRAVDANALALALAGSGDELVDRICSQMPKRTAREFRRELRRMGPTRLSDVEAAQRLMAHQAALQLAHRRQRPVEQLG